MTDRQETVDRTACGLCENPRVTAVLLALLVGFLAVEVYLFWGIWGS